MKAPAALVVLLGLATISLAVTPPMVAMRVDIETVRPIGEETCIAIIVQVAPEDRSRVGRDAWVKVELQRGNTTIDRFDRAVEMERGAARLEQTWPPGSYQLRVDVEGIDASGFWVGPITIPDLTAPATEPEPPQPAAPKPQPVPEPAAEPETVAPETVAPTAEAVAPATVPPATVAPEIVEPDAQPAAEPETVAPVTGTTPGPVAAPEPAAQPAVTAPPAAPDEPTAPEEPVAPVEPPPAVAPAEAPPAETEVFEEPAEPGVDPAAAFAASLQPGQAELTVMVTHHNRPVSDLERPGFTLLLDGDKTPIETIVPPDEAPLSLGLAVDTSGTMAEHLHELRRMLGHLSLKAAGERGRFFLMTLDQQAELALDWDASPKALATALETTGSSDRADLATLVSRALAHFEGRSGRRCLVLVSDGGDSSAKADWKAAHDAARSAAVPVLLIGFDGDALTSGTRSQLEKIVDTTGGESYFMRDTLALRTVIDFYSGLLDASYVLRYRPGASKAGKVRKVKVEAGAYEVHHPHWQR